MEIHRSHQRIPKRKRKWSACCRNGILSFPSGQGPLPCVNSNSSRPSKAKDPSRNSLSWHRLPSGIARSTPFKITDYFDVSPITGTSLFLTVVTIHKHNLALELFSVNLKALSRIQLTCSWRQWCTGEGDFFVFSGKIHKGKERKKEGWLRHLNVQIIPFPFIPNRNLLWPPEGAMNALSNLYLKAHGVF